MNVYSLFLLATLLEPPIPGASAGFEQALGRAERLVSSGDPTALAVIAQVIQEASSLPQPVQSSTAVRRSLAKAYMLRAYSFYARVQGEDATRTEAVSACLERSVRLDRAFDPTHLALGLDTDFLRLLDDTRSAMDTGRLLEPAPWISRAYREKQNLVIEGLGLVPRDSTLPVLGSGSLLNVLLDGSIAAVNATGLRRPDGLEELRIPFPAYTGVRQLPAALPVAVVRQGRISNDIPLDPAYPAPGHFGFMLGFAWSALSWRSKSDIGEFNANPIIGAFATVMWPSTSRQQPFPEYDSNLNRLSPRRSRLLRSRIGLAVGLAPGPRLSGPGVAVALTLGPPFSRRIDFIAGGRWDPFGQEPGRWFVGLGVRPF